MLFVILSHCRITLTDRKGEVSMTKHVLKPGRGAGNRRQHVSAPPASAPPAAPGHKSHATNSKLQVQSKHFVDPHFPFQPLPTPLGKPPFRFDLSELLHA